MAAATDGARRRVAGQPWPVEVTALDAVRAVPCGLNLQTVRDAQQVWFPVGGGLKVGLSGPTFLSGVAARPARSSAGSVRVAIAVKRRAFLIFPCSFLMGYGCRIADVGRRTADVVRRTA